MAVPRDVDAAVGSFEGITLLDMTDVMAFARQGREARRRGAPGRDDRRRGGRAPPGRPRHPGVAPVIGALHDRGEEIRLAELDRFRARLAGLSDVERVAVEALTRGIVGKLLHDPTMALKGAAGTTRGERLSDATQDLFDL